MVDANRVAEISNVLSQNGETVYTIGKILAKEGEPRVEITNDRILQVNNTAV